MFLLLQGIKVSLFVASRTEDTEAGRVVVVLQPLVERRTSVDFLRYAMLASAAVDMVNLKRFYVIVAALNALRTAVSVQRI